MRGLNCRPQHQRWVWLPIRLSLWPKWKYYYSALKMYNVTLFCTMWCIIIWSMFNMSIFTLLSSTILSVILWIVPRWLFICYVSIPLLPTCWNKFFVSSSAKISMSYYILMSKLKGDMIQIFMYTDTCGTFVIFLFNRLSFEYFCYNWYIMIWWYFIFCTIRQRWLGDGMWQVLPCIVP